MFLLGRPIVPAPHEPGAPAHKASRYLGGDEDTAAVWGLFLGVCAFAYFVQVAFFEDDLARHRSGRALPAAAAAASKAAAEKKRA